MNCADVSLEQEVPLAKLSKDNSDCFRLAFKKRQAEHLASCGRFLQQNFASEIPDNQESILELSRHMMIGVCSEGQLLYYRGSVQLTKETRRGTSTCCSTASWS